MYNNKPNGKRVDKNLMDSFTINNQTFNIILTNHAVKRLQERNIDKFQAIGAIMAIGQNKILEYKDTNKDIMVIDKQNNFSIVATIEGQDIVIITLIDKSDIYVKEGTTAINLY